MERFLNVPVDYYVKFNFESFVQIVDSIGGIDIDVPVTFTEQDSKDQAGMIHLEKRLPTFKWRTSTCTCKNA